MKIKEIHAKSIITKSDYEINPYVGCGHGCVYCSCYTQPGNDLLLRPIHKSIHYAHLMKHFTGHHDLGERSVNVKINAPELIPNQSYRGKRIVLSSATDPYQPVEKEYELTRKILEKLVPLQPDLRVLTKSSLITRDFDLLKQFENCEVGVSVSTLDERIRKEMEPDASSAKERLRALKKAKEDGLKTFVFLSPILPGITDYREIITEFDGVAGSFFFENLDVQGVWGSVRKWLTANHPELVEEYERIYFTNNNYWADMEKEIKTMGKDVNIHFNNGVN